MVACRLVGGLVFYPLIQLSSNFQGADGSGDSFLFSDLSSLSHGNSGIFGAID